MDGALKEFKWYDRKVRVQHFTIHIRRVENCDDMAWHGMGCDGMEWNWDLEMDGKGGSERRRKGWRMIPLLV